MSRWSSGESSSASGLVSRNYQSDTHPKKRKTWCSTARKKQVSWSAPTARFQLLASTQMRSLTKSRILIGAWWFLTKCRWFLLRPSVKWSPSSSLTVNWGSPPLLLGRTTELENWTFWLDRSCMRPTGKTCKIRDTWLKCSVLRCSVKWLQISTVSTWRGREQRTARFSMFVIQISSSPASTWLSYTRSEVTRSLYFLIRFLHSKS